MIRRRFHFSVAEEERGSVVAATILLDCGEQKGGNEDVDDCVHYDGLLSLIRDQWGMCEA